MNDAILLALKELDRLATREIATGGSGERIHQIEVAARTELAKVETKLEQQGKLLEAADAALIHDREAGNPSRHEVKTVAALDYRVARAKAGA